MRISDWFAAGLALGEVDDMLVVLVTLETGDAESSSEFPEDPSACHPSSRNMTPRNTSTITMARMGSPVESGTRSFIEPHCSESGHLEAEAPGGPRLLPAGAQPSQPLHQHGVGGQGLGPVDERVEHLVVARRRHREQLLDGV